MHEIELSGLEGGNLLGFLAAIGALRVLTLLEPKAGVRLRWLDKGRWTPILHHSRIGNLEELVDVLAQKLTPIVTTTITTSQKSSRKRFEDHSNTLSPLRNINRAYSQDFLDMSLSDFHVELRAVASELTDREVADFIAALGSDCFSEVKDGDQPATTEFRAIGAGNNDGFLGYMRTIHAETKAEHLKKALFLEWDYADTPPFMRWDPMEYRPHALRADDPAKDRKRNNVRGANRLAIEALPLFPTAPERRRLRTVGFADRNGVEITWPLWEAHLDLATIGSLLASEDIQVADRILMARRGVTQIFRSRRFTEGKYRNFSPARALL